MKRARAVSANARERAVRRRMAASSDALPPSFDRIYLDSEPMIAAGWPRISTELLNVLRFANVLGIGVFLPEATREELEAHWLRQAVELLGKIGARSRPAPGASTARGKSKARTAAASR